MESGRSIRSLPKRSGSWITTNTTGRAPSRKRSSGVANASWMRSTVESRGDGELGRWRDGEQRSGGAGGLEIRGFEIVRDVSIPAEARANFVSHAEGR